MTVVATREEWAPGKKLGEDAADGPDVNRLGNGDEASGRGNVTEGAPTHLGVHLEGQHDLWGAVPAGSDVFRHNTNFLACGDAGLDASSQPEVADLEVAVGIEEEVSRLQVTMNNIGTVDGLQGPESLINEILSTRMMMVSRIEGMGCVSRTWQ